MTNLKFLTEQQALEFNINMQRYVDELKLSGQDIGYNS